MTPQEEQLIAKWNDTLLEHVQIGLIQTGDKRSVQFYEFCQKLSTLAPKIEILEISADDAELPGIKIRDNLFYHAIPLGKELDPFLEGIALQGKTPKLLAGSSRQELEAINEPVGLQLFIAQQCPHCPLTVRQLIPLTMVNPLIRLTIIDGMLFTEFAASKKIMSVPTVLLDDHRWMGSTSLQEIVDVLLQKEVENLSPSSLIKILEEGKAAELANMMLVKGNIFESFLELLVHEKWSVRLGAIVAVETLIQENLEIASQLIEPLWNRYSGADDSVKGDLIYIFGEMGDMEMASKLEAMLQTETNEEIKDALNEAIESIAERQKSE